MPFTNRVYGDFELVTYRDDWYESLRNARATCHRRSFGCVFTSWYDLPICFILIAVPRAWLVAKIKRWSRMATRRVCLVILGNEGVVLILWSTKWRHVRSSKIRMSNRPLAKKQGTSRRVGVGFSDPSSRPRRSRYASTFFKRTKALPRIRWFSPLTLLDRLISRRLSV